MTGTVDFVLPPLVQSALDAQVDAMTAQARADAAYALAAAASGGSSALTTKGDLLVYTTDLARLGVGTDGQVLTADAASAAGVKWANPTGGSSPLTAKGDIFVHSTVDTRLAVGTNGQVLIADSGQAAGMRWGTNAPAYSAITSIPAAIDAIDGLTPAANKVAYYTGASAAALTDLTAYGISLIGSANAAAALALIAPTTTNGDIIVHSGGVATRLAKGTDGQVLTMVAGAVAWANAAGGGSSPLTTKGDLYAYSTADARLAVGTDGQILYADSTQPTGLKWGAAPSGSLPTEGSEGDVLTVVSGSWTSAAPATQDLSNLTATWNNAGTTFYGIKYGVTPTAYAAGSRILSLWYSGLETFYVAPSGGVAYTKNHMTVGSGANISYNGELKVNSNGKIGFSSSATVDSSSGSWEAALTRGGTGYMNVRAGTSLTAGGALNFLEMAAPGTPAANSFHLYAEDNGSSKTRIVVKWDDGTTTVLATQT